MVKKAENVIVGISIGDLNGIGPEVLLKTFEDNRVLEFCTPVVFSNIKILSYIKKVLGLEINLHGIDSMDQLVHGRVNVLNIWKEGVNIEFGKNDPIVGKYAVKSFQAVVESLKKNEVDIMLTSPINKYNVQGEGFDFPGHTDYLDKELDGEALMLMVNEELRIGLLTDHLPLNRISKSVTPDLLTRKLDIFVKTLEQDFRIVKPKVAVLGLNPHSGDNGVIGFEEEKIIKPTIKKVFDSGKMVFGPFSADGFFGSREYEKYDGILAMYHDQGLIPFKTLSFGKGVNFTAGLDRIRTSPDHGTAYEISGKGVANHESFREALYLALDIYNRRKEHFELIENPLKLSK